MPGFFTDEPQYFRYATVWSDILPDKFMERYGYDIFTALDAMLIDFEGAEEFRYDYWHLCHDLFINNFVKVIYDWCNENGCQLTGHAVEEASLSGQMWCCGGIMPFYEYEHIPGMDHLGRDYDQGIASKQLGSACAQLGKKKVMSEMFACCGWDVLPSELKKIAESQYVAGVNLMCQHLYPYSERGQRKRDYPAHYSQHLPWQKQMKHFDLLLIGVRPDYQDRGVTALIFNEQLPYYVKYKIQEVETTSILETNHKNQANFALLEHIQHKRRRAYIKPL